MKKIIVYCEINNLTRTFDDVTYQLLSKARELKYSASLIGKTSDVKDYEYFVEAVALAPSLSRESISNALRSGADRVVLLKDSSFDIFVQTILASAFVEYFNSNPADIIIFPATPYGRIIAPRITTMLNTGLVADCTGLDFVLKKGELRLAPTRPTFGSELMATILSKKNPQCATIRPNVFKAEFVDSVEINMDNYTESLIKYPFEENRIKLINAITDKKTDKPDFLNAKVVLAAGFGIASGKKGEYFDKLEKLSRIMCANYAVTRKVVEMGYADKKYQIGQTGSTTQADLYIAFGVSGAIQHIAGMKNSKTIIAVNNDENADIFKYSDYKIVADAKKMIDEIYAML